MGSASSALVSLMACAGTEEKYEDEESAPRTKGARLSAGSRHGAMFTVLTGTARRSKTVEEEDDEITDRVYDDAGMRSESRPSSPQELRRSEESDGRRSPVRQLEACEALFLDEFILMLKEGFLVKKHGRRGAARERFVRLSEAGDEIGWASEKAGGRRQRPESASQRDTSYLRVQDLADVRRGVFDGRAIPPGTSPETCVSLISTQRSVNLEFPDEEVRELCADGFTLLMNRAKQKR